MGADLLGVYALALALKFEIKEQRALLVAAGVITDLDEEPLARHRMVLVEELSEIVSQLGLSGDTTAELISRVEGHLASIHEFARGWRRKDCSDD